MKKKTPYETSPFGKVTLGKRVPDFLPSPQTLAAGMKTSKVTLSLSQESLRFFKEEAKRNGVPYQAMIRELLDIYAQSRKH